MFSGRQKITNDVFWLIGKDFLDNPQDVVNLSLTNKALQDSLGYIRFRHDINKARQYQLEKDKSNKKYKKEYRDLHDASKLPLELHKELIRTRSVLTRPIPRLIELIENDQFEIAMKFIDVAQEFWPFYLETKGQNCSKHVTAAPLAASKGYIEMVKKLHKAGCLLRTDSEPWYRDMGDLFNIAHPKNQSLSPRRWRMCELEYQGDCLSLAIAEGHTDMALWLINDTDVLGSGETVEDRIYIIQKLCIAATVDNIEIVTVLLDRMTTSMDEFSVSPLRQALMYYGSLPLIRLLINRGADVNARKNPCFGRPLHMAAEREEDKLECCKLLITAGADPSIGQDLDEWEGDATCVGHRPLDGLSRDDQLNVLIRLMAKGSTNADFLDLTSYFCCLIGYARDKHRLATLKRILMELLEMDEGPEPYGLFQCRLFHEKVYEWARRLELKARDQPAQATQLDEALAHARAESSVEDSEPGVMAGVEVDDEETDKLREKFKW